MLTAAVLLSLAQSPTPFVGQWVWSRKDFAPLEGARAITPVDAAVQVAELRWSGTKLISELRLAPHDAAPVVIRFDDSLHTAWNDPSLAQEVDAALGRVIGLAAQAGARPSAVQLDYDCPTRLLASWARLVTALQLPGAALAGREVWVTTIPATFLAPEFATLFQGHIAGHLAQVFDTGSPWTLEREDQWSRAHEAAGITFALGLGGFEREGHTGAPNASWVRALPRLRASSSFRGTWVFCGGHAWPELARALKGSPR